MNPYSHIVVASKLEAHIHPADAREYYWGAIAPDVRYPAAMRREKTHLPAEKILEWFARYPHLKPFLQGYLVHCLCDELDLSGIFFRRFPLTLLRSRFARQPLSVILELYYLENEHVVRPISGIHNEVLDELGVRAEVSANFAQAVSHYAGSSSHSSRLLELFRLLGLENDSRIEKYMTAARGFQENRLLLRGLFLGMRIGRISERIATNVTALLPARLESTE